MPQTKDYQTHAAEIKIDALPVGEYLLLTSSGVGFVDSLHKMTKQIIYVSNISYIKNVNDYFFATIDSDKYYADQSLYVCINYPDDKSNNLSYYLAILYSTLYGFFFAIFYN